MPYRASSAPSGDEPLYCFYCGGALFDRRCTRCGLFALPPQPALGALVCPRCDGAMLASESVGDLWVHGCPRCRGCFMTRAEWDALLVRVQAREHTDVKLMVPPPPGAGPSPEALFRMAACPACRQPTDRFAFATASKTTVDVCAPHGIWFDAVELVAVLGILTQRLEGIDVAPSPQEEEKERQLAFMREVTAHAVDRIARIGLTRRW
jgi:Zn-finger nucleic acid-binding protein